MDYKIEPSNRVKAARQCCCFEDEMKQFAAADKVQIVLGVLLLVASLVMYFMY